MDDDFTFGASVWGATEPPPVVSKPTSLIGLPPSSLVSSPPTFQDDGFGDFDDFEGPQANQDVSFNGDDFDDFGDFGDVDAVPPSASGFGFGGSIAGPSVQREWQPLYLDPVPSHLELQEEVEEILGPVWDDEALARAMSDEQIREVEGVGQILQYAERYAHVLWISFTRVYNNGFRSRDLFNNIVKLAPPTKPPNWVRSKIRRQHLIALGIPVNLDEVLEPQANTKSMPSLQVNTRPMSAPPGPRNGHIYTGAITSSLSNSRSGTPQPGNRGQSSHFGPKPELDQVKIHSLLQLDPGMLRRGLRGGILEFLIVARF